MMKKIAAVLTSLAALIAQSAFAALPEQPVGLPDGAYNCIAGFRIMLTLGQVTLSHGHYTFKTQQGQGPTTSGSYTLAGDRTMTFSGDFGAIRQDNILKAHQEPFAVNAFAFSYIVPGEKLPTSASCKKM